MNTAIEVKPALPLPQKEKQLQNQHPKKKQKKRGRPKKRKVKKVRGIKRTFDDTKVGHFLKYEAPLEYELLINSMGAGKAPSADMIEMVGYASINPLFKKPKFRRALIEYRKKGLYHIVPRPPASPSIEMYYIRVRSGNSVKQGTNKIMG